MKSICTNALENVSGGHTGLISVALLVIGALWPQKLGSGTMKHDERLDAIAAQQRDGFYSSEPF